MTKQVDDSKPVDDFGFTKAKQKVFDSAIELFSSKGFEGVSIRDIASYVGTASMYYHFASKQEILDNIYDYYVQNFNNNRIPIEKMKQILKDGTKEEFCAALMFTFQSEDEEHYKRMSLITKIIYMRIYQDEKARDIFLNLMNADTERYVNEILEYGVSIGRLQSFDIPIYSKFLVGQRHIMGMKAFTEPHYTPSQLDEEVRIMKMSADMLPFVTKNQAP